MSTPLPYLGEALSLGCAAAWGVSVILFKRSTEEISPWAMNLFKNSTAFVLLGLTLLATGGSLPADRSPADWARVIASGVLGLAVADTLFLEALRRIGAGMLAILDCVYAPTVALFSVLMLGEELGWAFALGAALVVGGLFAATTSGEGLREAATVARAHVGGVLIGLVSIALMAFSVVLAKPVLDQSDLVETTFTRMIAGSVPLGIYVLLFRKDRREIFRVFVPQPSWRRLVPAMLLGTYVSMLLWLGGIKYTPSPSVASVLNQLSVLFTLGLARVWLNEPMSPRKMVGGGASLAGAIVIILFATQ